MMYPSTNPLSSHDAVLAIKLKQLGLSGLNDYFACACSKENAWARETYSLKWGNLGAHSSVFFKEGKEKC